MTETTAPTRPIPDAPPPGTALSLHRLGCDYLSYLRGERGVAQTTQVTY